MVYYIQYCGELMNNSILGNKYLRVNLLGVGLVSLKVAIPNLTENTFRPLDDALNLLIKKNYKHLIIDLSEVDYMNSKSVIALVNKLVDIESLGGSMRLLISENNPTINYSIGNPISEVCAYLNVESAISDFTTSQAEE